jgi:hypothetical protein
MKRRSVAAMSRGSRNTCNLRTSSWTQVNAKKQTKKLLSFFILKAHGVLLSKTEEMGRRLLIMRFQALSEKYKLP